MAEPQMTEEEMAAAAALIPMAQRLAQEARFLTRGSDKPLADAITVLAAASGLLIAFSVEHGSADPDAACAQSDKTTRTMTRVFMTPRMN